ncbi:hypothetical protein F2Q68_00021238 [Brassica cretica]|uniref:Uncharacterized protein n=1 Tax=Brassica cretica TaxID=69181 RepID=A0A8S9FQ65_BRACR|nr:hypothetical protein F2Q68_00021238 [Brassica cretica]
MNVQRDIGTLNDQHDFPEECSTSIDRFHRASLDVKKPTEHPPTAAEVDQITSKLYTTIDTMEDRFEKRCDDIYFPFDVRLSGLDSHAEWDPDGHARAMDGRILQVCREDIANILRLANEPDNLFIQQRSIQDNIPAVPDNIPAVPDEHPRADTT